MVAAQPKVMELPYRRFDSCSFDKTRKQQKKMDVGQAIKTLRIKQGMTQSQLADRIGMSTNAVCSMETGRTYPPKSTVEKLCQAFGIPQAFFQMAAIEEGDFPEAKHVLYGAMLEPLRNELLSEDANRDRTEL